MALLTRVKDTIQGNSRLREQIKSIGSLGLRVFPIQSNKVVLDNFHGKGYGDNPKYIAEELRKRGGYQIVWLCNDLSENFPDGIQVVKRHSVRSFYESATSKAWVFNIRYGKLTKKRKSQILLQTWHGSIALKKVEADAADKLDYSYLKKSQEDGSIADGILVDGKSNEELFKSSFWLGPMCELLCFGTPRTDMLLKEKGNAALKERVRNKLGIESSSYFVLYAPTFRSNGAVDSYLSDFVTIQKAFESKYGKTMMAVRLHPNLREAESANEWMRKSELIDATSYPDVDELVIAADCLITDYSSIAYDFAVISKPVFLYVNDMEEYISDRGVYDIFYEQPFRLNRDMEMLLEDITQSTAEEYAARLARFYEKYPTYNDGTASARSVDWLESKGLRPKK